MSKDHVKEWQEILKQLDNSIIIDGDFGKASLTVSKKIAEKANIIPKPEPIPNPQPTNNLYTVHNDRLYYNDIPVKYIQSEMTGGFIDPKYIIIHYTGTNGDSTDWLTNYHENPVSAHLLIYQDGSVKQFAEFTDECWHAGKSNWGGLSGFNKFSIGIETQGTGKVFSEKLMDALINIINALLKAYPQIKGVLGHDTIAKGRKPDPGKNFDWSRIPKSLV